MRTHQPRNHHHRHRRKSAEFDLGLAELRRFGSDDKITRGCALTAAAQAMTVDSGNGDAVGVPEPPEDGVKSGKHLVHAILSVSPNFCSSREAFWSRAPENDASVLVRERTERLIERPHHGDINDVERRAIECDPDRRALRANMDCLGNGFALGHRLVQKRLGSSSRMTASSAPLGGKVSSKSSATRRSEERRVGKECRTAGWANDYEAEEETNDRR